MKRRPIFMGDNPPLPPALEEDDTIESRHENSLDGSPLFQVFEDDIVINPSDSRDMSMFPSVTKKEKRMSPDFYYVNDSFVQSTINYHIMSRMLDTNSHPWTWSSCSRDFLSELFDSERGLCLTNHPNQDILSKAAPSRITSLGLFVSHLNQDNNIVLPGQLFDMDYQCELVFGKGSAICPYMPVCKRLWCTIPGSGGCRTQHMPWADGTRCGVRKECHNGECVANQRLVKIDGGWGTWTPFSSCSRECGGGIQSSTRECDSPRCVRVTIEGH